MLKLKTLIAEARKINEADAAVGPDWGSEKSIARVKSEWERIAKSKFDVEYIGGAYYGYGDELACYRVEHKYNNRPKVEAGFSKNLNKWYVRLELEK